MQLILHNNTTLRKESFAVFAQIQSLFRKIGSKLPTAKFFQQKRKNFAVWPKRKTFFRKHFLPLK